MPAARRSVRWQVDDISMLLGSDTLVLRLPDASATVAAGARPAADDQTGGTSASSAGASSGDGSASDTESVASVSSASGSPPLATASLALHDISHQLTSLHCVDLWLTNVMAAVPATAICYHREGQVAGYQLVKTEDLPALPSHSIAALAAGGMGGGIGSGTAHAAGGTGDGNVFSKLRVKYGGVSVLRFLQQHCVDDFSTYFLTRREGDNTLMLHEVSRSDDAHTGGEDLEEAADEEDRGQNNSEGTDSTDRHRCDGSDATDNASAADEVSGAPVAMLCFRIAERIFNSRFDDSLADVREARRLFVKCAALLKPSRRRCRQQQMHHQQKQQQQ